MIKKKFPLHLQLYQRDCGPTCLQMVADYYGKHFNLQSIREASDLARGGVSLLGISKAAESLGFRTLPTQISFEQFIQDVPLPCVLHWEQEHFVVAYKVDEKKKWFSKGNEDTEIHIADPSEGIVKLNSATFKKYWISDVQDGEEQGIALLLEPTPAFFEREEDRKEKISWSLVTNYLKQHKKVVFQLMIGLIVGSFLQLVFPFLTQSIVDVGIMNQNISFIYLILIAQLMLFLGRTSIEFIRSWILLHVSNRINISLLSDFFIKLMKVPMSFFDTKMFGDILQRIDDHNKIETFMSNETLRGLFSMVNLIIFGAVLYWYNTTITLVFAFGSALYILWVLLFLKERRNLDYSLFRVQAKIQSSVVQLIQGMAEIKLNNCKLQRRWEWESIQVSMHKLKVKRLRLDQYQMAGGFFINEGKNIFITFLAAAAVINGELTLGAMLAIQYIIGQLNAPIEQFVFIIRMFQDAQIGLERINEVHRHEEEQPKGKTFIQQIPQKEEITVNGLSFAYPGTNQNFVLSDINLTFPKAKTTAIVGMSGSGKTTLMKLLLKFYESHSGEIKIGNTNLNNLAHDAWWGNCGVVMQDGFIFSDTIARNIAPSEININFERLLHAVEMANIQDFVFSLPLGFNTIIGQEGVGISQGQRQRLLIARAIYKDPDYIFFDEATNALDANNEKVILENLNEFFQGKTVIIVAHRLSTVKNADQIVVLDQGVITESGTHEFLTSIKGDYYSLVKNQLELGS